MSAENPCRMTATPEFAPVVFHYTDALRYLRDQGPLDVVAMADGLNRVRSNAKRDALKLAEAGVVTYDGTTITLTDLGRQWVSGQDVAQGLATAGQGGEPGSQLADTDPRWPHQRSQILFLSHAQILPDTANARRDWDSEDARSELDALRQDILENGLLQNLVVTGPTTTGDWSITCPDGAVLPAYTLAGGERRWRAIGLAIADDDWPATRAIPCRLLETDATGLRIAALSENLQRRNLNPIEKAHGFEGLAEAGLSNQDIADRFGKTPEHIQQHRRFLQLDEADQQRMTLTKDDPRRLGVKEARLKLAAEDKAEAPPPELPVSPTARLLLAELMHAARTHADHTYGDIEVGAEAIGNATMRELIEAHEVRPCELRSYGARLGRYVTALGHGATFAAFPWARNGDDELAAGLAAEQRLLLDLIGEAAQVTEDGPYLTPWLNGPFELTPEGQACVDAQKAAVKEREALVTANVAAREAAVERGRLAAERAAALMDTVRAERAVAVAAEVFSEVAVAADAPLPWRVTMTGGVEAADGSVIITGGHALVADRGLARMRLLVLAANAAAGLETPEDEQPEPVQDINGCDPDAVEDDAEADASE